MRSEKRYEDMIDLEDWSEDDSLSFIKGLRVRERKAGFFYDGLHARDESLLPATRSIFFCNSKYLNLLDRKSVV